MEIGALDEVSGGRVSLSLGSGVAGPIEQMGFSYDKPLSAVRDAVAIVRAMLRGEKVHYRGKVFCAEGVKLGYVARSDIPIYVAGRGDQTLHFCGEAADGWIALNMCTPGFVAQSADKVFAAAKSAMRARSPEIVRYVPCSVQVNCSEAESAAKSAIAEMLPGFVTLSKRLATVQFGLVQGSGIEEDELDDAARRLRAGEDPGQVLDERFVAAYAIAGTPQDCLEQACAHRALGITDLALTFTGTAAHDEMRLLAGALAGNSVSKDHIAAASSH